MKCFYHSSIDAVAICKNCSKGLCRDCAVDLIHGTACKNKCEEQVETWYLMMHENKSLQKGARHAYRRSSVIYFLSGLIMISVGASVPDNTLKLLFISAGSVFILGSIFTYVNSKAYPS
jgi:hypothetical protein